MAAPILTIQKIAGNDVSAGISAETTITPATATPWKVEGTVQHERNKQITAMWYYISGIFRLMIPFPPEAGDPNNTSAVDWMFFLTSSDFPPGNFNPLPSNGDYELKIYALNCDGSSDQTRIIHVVNFQNNPGGPGPGPGPGPTPTPPPAPAPVL